MFSELSHIPDIRKAASPNPVYASWKPLSPSEGWLAAKRVVAAMQVHGVARVGTFDARYPDGKGTRCCIPRRCRKGASHLPKAATWNTPASSTFYPELRPANQTEEVPIERG